MSFLAEELERQLARTNQSIDDLVPKTGLSRAQLYLWKRSEQTSINEEQLSSLASALSDDPLDHAALLRSHLLDETFGPASELLRIEIDHPSVVQDRPRPRSKGEKAMAFFAEERLRNRDLNDLLIDLARVMGAFEDEPNSARQMAEETVDESLGEHEAGDRKRRRNKPSEKPAT